MHRERPDDCYEIDCAQCHGRYEVSAASHPRVGWLCGPCSHGEKAACKQCGCWDFKLDLYVGFKGWLCDACAQAVYESRMALAESGR